MKTIMLLAEEFHVPVSITYSGLSSHSDCRAVKQANIGYFLASCGRTGEYPRRKSKDTMIQWHVY
jgi:hypothetical protein